MVVWKFLLRKVHYLGFVGAIALAWSTYITSGDAASQLQNNYEYQENAKALDQLNIMMQRTQSALSTSIAINQPSLFSAALSDFDKLLEFFNTDAEIDYRAVGKVLPQLQSLRQNLAQVELAFSKGQLPSKADMKVLFNTFEQSRASLTELSNTSWKRLAQGNNSIVRMENRDNLISSITQAFLSFILVILMVTGIQRERDQKIIHASESLYKVLFASLAEGVILTLHDGRITFCNDSAGKLLHMDPAKLVGKKFSDIYPTVMKSDGSYFPSVQHPINMAAESDKSINNLTMGLDFEEKGVRWLSLNSQPVFDPDISDNLAAVISLSDITERVKDQQIIVEQQMQMAQVSKMSALGEMAGGVAHEINNPLAIIHAQADELKDLTEDDDLEKEDIVMASSVIQKTVNRISKIVKGLRTFAREGSSDPFVDVKVKDLIEEISELTRMKLQEQNTDLIVDEIDPEMTVSCRATQIEQVLMNLIHNASDAVQNLAEKWVKLEAIDVDDQVIISVTDSGLGIPEEVREKIFQPFFTTKGVGKGTGLGMSISKGIIDAHNGDLFIDPKCPNTRFVMVLPKRRGIPDRISA